MLVLIFVFYRDVFEIDKDKNNNKKIKGRSREVLFCWVGYNSFVGFLYI